MKTHSVISEKLGHQHMLGGFQMQHYFRRKQVLEEYVVLQMILRPPLLLNCLKTPTLHSTP